MAHESHSSPAHRHKGHGGKGKPGAPQASGDPVFAQPAPSPDPTSFRNPVTDQSDKDTPGVQVVPPARGGAVEPVLTLAQVFGSQGETITQTIQSSGQIVFHSVGDTGSVEGPSTQSLVADKMVTDFSETSAADVPSFFFHLGDVVYYFGEATYYYDQFFEPYRSYPAPIIAIPGNHDGIVYPSDSAPTLDAFLRNFCAASAAQSPDAGGLLRTTMIAPGVYFTLEAPFVRILGVYSNVLEDPGVISAQGTTYPTLDSRQVDFLTAALKRVTTDDFTGAVIIAVHHPPFSGGSVHGGSPLMLADIDSACQAAGVWPHAVFSGHAHNYQRFTRIVNSYQTPYIVAGCGGHSPLSKMSGTYRTPYKVDDTLTLESYDDTDYGYLRVVVNAQTMTVEFHPQSDGSTTKTPDDTVTIDLATRTIS
ncbi:metallophosphoesterase family protein [Paracidobacterium acidisoli]|uniref:Metallophosphoesterase n=1 Tax=Paracidobacterium acidisoli TaxID=2303751 RepID=A0A372IQ07_9BACT|nr:metallophosphoesterase [Paracidobacterium acidisoli]MBT9331159.1 metallophosphoesterase [Paracidobacterium acidisoli]